MSTHELIRGSSATGGSALSDFLKHSIVYEKAGAVIPRDLLQFGLFGSVVVIVTGVVALLLPDPASIERGEFFLVLGSAAASLDSLLHGLAVPAIVCGVLLLALDLCLMNVPTSEHWRLAVVGQAAAGGIGGGLGVIFLALVVLNLALWIAICACILAGCCLLLSGLGS